MSRSITTAAPIARDLVRSRGRSLRNAWIDRAMLTAMQGRRWIVFDSDDWGGQRIPSRKVFDQLLSVELVSGESAYDRDTLEHADDLTALAEVLAAATGADGGTAVFSAYCNPANPDFDAIRRSGFSAYHFEPFTTTLARRGDETETMAAWQQAMHAGVIVPQYHGREHLQVQAWLEALAASDRVRMGFDLGYYSVALPSASEVLKGFRAANFFRRADELDALAEIIRSGADCFAQVFGTSAEIYCPTNNVFHPALYAAVREAGCRSIVRHMRNKTPDGRGGLRTLWGPGPVAAAGLAWHGRNATFEPVQGFGVDHALAGIASAFAWGIPAIISTHRVNYVGGIDVAQRDRGLFALRELLREIRRRWPDACYVSSARLSECTGS